VSTIDWPARARDLAPAFASRAEQHDREGSFPFENFADLRSAGFCGLTVPRRFGGADEPPLARIWPSSNKSPGPMAPPPSRS